MLSAFISKRSERFSGWLPNLVFGRIFRMRYGEELLTASYVWHRHKQYNNNKHTIVVQSNEPKRCAEVCLQRSEPSPCRHQRGHLISAIYSLWMLWCQMWWFTHESTILRSPLLLAPFGEFFTCFTNILCPSIDSWFLPVSSPMPNRFRGTMELYKNSHRVLVVVRWEAAYSEGFQLEILWYTDTDEMRRLFVGYWLCCTFHMKTFAHCSAMFMY